MSSCTLKGYQGYKHRRLQDGFSVFFIFLALIVSGCGIKGPPVAPRRKPPPPVHDLSYRIDGNILTLSWAIPEKIARNASPPSGFKVYRSKIAAAKSDCKNCPPNFTEVGDIPAVIKSNQEKRPVQISFSETLESGYRYIFMIRGYRDNGNLGSDSNYIDFVFQ
jgi:hypothetical protein